MWGREARKRERSVRHSGDQLQAEGGDRVGNCRLLCGGSAWRLSAVEPRLSLLYTMCVGWTALIAQNVLNIVKSCNEMKRFIFHWKKCAVNCWRHIVFASYYWFSIIIADKGLAWYYKAWQECNQPPEFCLHSLMSSLRGLLAGPLPYCEQHLICHMGEG